MQQASYVLKAEFNRSYTEIFSNPGTHRAD